VRPDKEENFSNIIIASKVPATEPGGDQLRGKGRLTFDDVNFYLGA
jgi:hypothetical protein